MFKNLVCKTNIVKGKKIILLYVIAMFFCVPVIWATRYTVYWADDFTHYNSLCSMAGSNMIVKAFEYTAQMYINWQGTYAAIFLQSVVSPFIWGSTKIIRVIALTNSISFFIGLFFFYKMLINTLGMDGEKAIIPFLLTVIPLFSYNQYNEAFLWITGLFNYTFPITMSLLSMVLLNKYDDSKKNTFLKVLSYIFSFLAVGGSLEISGLTCMLIILLWSIRKCTGKQSNKDFVILFLISLIGSVINAFSPGNFSRHQIFDSNHISLFQTIFYSVKICILEIEKLLSNHFSIILICIVVAFFIGLYFDNRHIDSKRQWIIIMEIIIVPIITVFPVVMGYSLTTNILPNRTAFIFDLSLISCSLSLVYIVGYNTKKLKVCESSWIPALVVLCILSIPFGGTSIENNYVFKISSSIIDGSINKYAASIINAYTEVKYSNDKNLTVKYMDIPDWFNVSTLSDDINDWKNKSIAEYYGKDSVKFIKG